ncbi:hypothetical protein PWT90_07599 [Aphanocladium album]|nr:hypothetical protein PWT90_07599 [Aphanocladium album]
MVSPRRDVSAYIEQEFSLGALEKITRHLGFAGYIYPSRPLHTQQGLGWKPVVTERMDLHLVLENSGKRIYMKPIPAMMLIPQFWTEYLSCAQNCACPATTTVPPFRIGELPRGCCSQRRMRMTALGFLYSYVALISHECDFHIARASYLLPLSVDWPRWQSLVYQLDTEAIYPRIHPRFIYGELRLAQLDLLLMATGQRLIPGFAGRWSQYSSLVHDNIAYIATATVFTGLILTAMQVGLATNRLSRSEPFQAVSYGFTVFAMVFPLLFFGLFLAGAAYGLTVRRIALHGANKKRLAQLKACHNA